MKRSDVLNEAADLIERRLVKTTGYMRDGKRLEDLDDYQRGIHFALQTAQALLREEAKK